MPLSRKLGAPHVGVTVLLESGNAIRWAADIKSSAGWNLLFRGASTGHLDVLFTVEGQSRN